MSHFSYITTKIKEKPILLEALEVLQYEVKQDRELVIAGEHGKNHPVVEADVCITNDIGFRCNPRTNSYDLVADEQTWSLDVPPSRFVEKVTQQYARMSIHNTVKELGFQVAEEWEMDDNSIELTVTRWV